MAKRQLKEPINARHIPLENACNFRDLGGLPIGEDRMTRFGKLFRSDSMHQLSQEDINRLTELGIRKVIDLRNLNELSAQPSVLKQHDGIHYEHIQLHSEIVSGGEVTVVEDLGDLYLYFIEACQPAIQKVIASLADEAEGAVAFHCTAGKDRTGIIAALLLDTAGVNHNEIVSDYVLSGTLTQELLDDLRRNHRPDKISSERYEAFLACEAEFLERMLNHIEQKYGGSEAYLRHIGLGSEKIDAVKRLLAE